MPNRRFDDGVAIISLGAPAVMRFTAPPAAAGASAADSPFASPCCSAPAEAPGALLASVLLEPGDCLLLCGAARCSPSLCSCHARLDQRHAWRSLSLLAVSSFRDKAVHESLRQVGRYNALHGFDAVKEERHEGRMITRGVRTSVTLRRLL